MTISCLWATGFTYYGGKDVKCAGEGEKGEDASWYGVDAIGGHGE